jgi:uncharacterized RDD family membrane protein YckC
MTTLTPLSAVRTPLAGPGASPRLAPGQDFGSYRIVRLLGRGGMGEVYDAEHLEHGRRLALKVLNVRLAGADDRERFLREGQLAAAVNHPNTVYIFGSEEIAGIPVIAMELVPGGTLKDLVKERGPLPPAEAVDAMLQVIAGLDAAQTAGVLHRDIKPANCFVGNDGLVKVGDFGLSISTLARDATQLTETGSFMGTPHFAAPEQLKGDALDVRSDIYAVGATLYYLLTGQPPFDDHTLAALVMRVGTEAPRSPRALQPGVSRGLAAVVLRCLEKAPSRRHPDYAALTAALQLFGSTAPRPGTLARRVAANVVDVAFLTLLVVPIQFGVSAYLPFTTESRLATDLLGVVYFVLLEGWYGATLGKMALGLTVIGPEGGVPGIPRALLRGIVFGASMELYLLFDPNVAGVLNLTWMLATLALFVTARRRNGFSGLHDLLSRTRVVRAVAEQGGRRAGAPLDVTAPQVAARVGPYAVRDRFETDRLGPAGIIVRGFDESLRRHVWIHVLPAGSSPLTAARRDLAEPGRLRWLTGRRSPSEAWDAYDAIDGQPLDALRDTRSDWATVRRWVVDLAETLHNGLVTGSLPPLSLDRVWVGHDGRAKLNEWPRSRSTAGGPPVAPAPPGGTPTTDAQTLGDAQRLLRDVISTTTEGGGPLPLRATEFVRRLETGQFFYSQDLLDSARALTRRPAVVRRPNRFLHLVMTAFIPGTYFVAYALPPLLRTLAFERRSELPALTLSLDRLLLLETNVAAKALVERVAPDRSVTETAADQRMRAYVSSLVGDQTALDAMQVSVSARFGDMLRRRRNDPLLNRFVGGNRLDAGDRALVRHPAPRPADRAKAEAVLEPVMSELAVQEGPARARRTTPIVRLTEVAGAIHFLALAFTLALLPSLLSALASRGGLGRRWFGLAVVTADGREVSAWRGLARAIIAWSPLVMALVVTMTRPNAVLLLNYPVLPDPFFPNSPIGPLAAVWLALLVGSATAALAMLAMAVWRPERSLQDRLAGTWLVPR